MTERREPRTLAEYLHQKHVDFIVEQRQAVSEAEWIAHLNKSLPAREKINKFSMNQWMNESREPDGRNIRRLLMVFGVEVLPFLGLELSPMLEQLIKHAGEAPPERIELALRILRGETEDEQSFSGELARVTA